MTEGENKELRALGLLAGRLTPPSDPTSGGGKSGKPIANSPPPQPLPHRLTSTLSNLPEA